MDFNLKTVTRNKEVCYIMIKESIYEEIHNNYKYIYMHPTSGHLIHEGNTNIYEKRNTAIKYKINKETLDLKHTFDQIDLTNMYRIFHSVAPKSHSSETFSRTDHMTGHKTSLIKYTMIEIMPWIFPDQKGIKLEINRGKNW